MRMGCLKGISHKRKTICDDSDGLYNYESSYNVK